MKHLLVVALCCVVAGAFALDNEGWISKAKLTLESGTTIDADETPEDGVYCLVMAQIQASDSDGADARIGKAQLEAKRKLTAFVHGETVIASRSVEKNSTTVRDGEEKTVKMTSKFESRIKTKVDAFVSGQKMIGQVTIGESSYVVMVASENLKDESAILKAAQSKYGEEGVVTSVGEADNRELAVQKALRFAVEQVLGTMIVGYDKTSSSEGYSSQLFSGTNGFVEKYDVLSEKDVKIGVRVEVVAKVSKKHLLDSYDTYMKFLGDPGFMIESNSGDLDSHFTQFFTDMDFRIAKNPAKATYVISCVGEYRPVKHPANGREGTQLSLRFKIQEMGGKKVHVDMKNDPRKSACFIGKDPERQKEICSEKAFNQMKDPVHEKIQAMMARLVAEKMVAPAAEE